MAASSLLASIINQPSASQRNLQASQSIGQGLGGLKQTLDKNNIKDAGQEILELTASGTASDEALAEVSRKYKLGEAGMQSVMGLLQSTGALQAEATKRKQAQETLKQSQARGEFDVGERAFTEETRRPRYEQQRRLTEAQISAQEALGVQRAEKGKPKPLTPKQLLDTENKLIDTIGDKYGVYPNELKGNKPIYIQNRDRDLIEADLNRFGYQGDWTSDPEGYDVPGFLQGREEGFHLKGFVPLEQLAEGDNDPSAPTIPPAGSPKQQSESTEAYLNRTGQI